MEPEFISYLLSLGVGGVIASLIFQAYRKDSKMYAELWKQNTDILLSVVKDNTIVMVQNTEVLKSLHRRLDELNHSEEILRVQKEIIKKLDVPIKG